MTVYEPEDGIDDLEVGAAPQQLPQSLRPDLTEGGSDDWRFGHCLDSLD